MWVRKTYQKRKQKGEFHLLVKGMHLHEYALFFQYFRMSPAQYEDLLTKDVIITLHNKCETLSQICSRDFQLTCVYLSCKMFTKIT